VWGMDRSALFNTIRGSSQSGFFGRVLSEHIACTLTAGQREGQR